MKYRLKKSARRVLEWFKLIWESLLDANRYYRSASWAGPVQRHFQKHLESDLIKHYHVIEKGLSMPDFKPRSGKELLLNLVGLSRLWKDSDCPADAFHYLASLAVINAYKSKHEQLGFDVSDLIPDGVLPDCAIGELPEAGSRPPQAISNDELATFDRIALSRHSVRGFATDIVPSRDSINEAVRIATSAPSVCNRQTWRVHFYSGDDAARVLALQNGNRGFGHLIPLVAIVTSDMRMFAGGAERYQAWIEGGMFGMNFLLALHARGIASIALNWSRLNSADKLLRNVAGVPEYERIIMLIGCGYAAAKHEVTCSPRSPIDQFAYWH